MSIDYQVLERYWQKLKSQEGRTSEEAIELAYRLILRDEDGCELRICPECRHWQGRRCTEGRKPLPYILQRHDCMDLRGSRAAAQPQVSAG